MMTASEQTGIASPDTARGLRRIAAGALVSLIGAAIVCPAFIISCILLESVTAVAIITITPIFAGWPLCIAGLVAWRRGTPPGPARRHLSAALAAHALLPASALALLDPDPFKGFLLTMGSLAILLTVIPTLALRGGQAVAAASGRLQDLTQRPSMVEIAWALAILAAGGSFAMAWLGDASEKVAMYCVSTFWGMCLYVAGLILLSKLRGMPKMLLRPVLPPRLRRERVSPSSTPSSDAACIALESKAQETASHEPSDPAEPAAKAADAQAVGAAVDKPPPARAPRPARIQAIPAPRSRRARTIAIVAVALCIPIILIGISVKYMLFIDQLMVYTSQEGRFCVTFPTVPSDIKVKTHTLPSEFGPFVFHYSGHDLLKSYGDAYAVTYCDLPAALSKNVGEERLLDFHLNVIQNALENFKIISKHPLSKGHYAGREVRGNFSKGGFRLRGTFRIYVAGLRVYWLEFIQFENASPSNPAPFFDSFVILDTPETRKPN
jgi:hypothetical protein